MFDILNHERNLNKQNIIEIPSHTCQNGYHEENKQQTGGQNVGKKATLNILFVGMYVTTVSMEISMMIS
jgi:hypothetical protein